MFNTTPDDSVSFCFSPELGGEAVCDIEGIARITDIRPRLWEIDLYVTGGVTRPLNDPTDPFWMAVRSAIEDHLIANRADDVWEARRCFYKGLHDYGRELARESRV